MDGERVVGWEGMERADMFRVAFDAARTNNECLGGSCTYPIGGQCACFVETLNAHRLAAIEEAAKVCEGWFNARWDRTGFAQATAIRNLAPPPPPAVVGEGGHG